MRSITFLHFYDKMLFLSCDPHKIRHFPCMTFEEIPQRMMKLGVDRAWLAKECDYSAGSLAAILAPNGNQKSKTDKALRRIWEALDREEARRSAPVRATMERQQLVLRPTDDEFEDWNRAAITTQETLMEWSMRSLNEQAAAAAARSEKTATEKSSA
jgi:hypothetical protein